MQSLTHFFMSAQDMLSSMIHSGFALRALSHSRIDSTSISARRRRASLRADHGHYEQKIAYRWKGVWTRTTMQPRELRLVQP